MHISVDVPFVFRRNHRHVAVRAHHRRCRVVERARTLPGNAAALPVVVFVESPNPAVVVERHVEVDLVAARAEFRHLLAHEWLQKDAAVRFRVQPHHKIVQAPHQRVRAGRQGVQLRVLKHEITLTHAAFHLHDAVAHQATQAGARFRTIHDLFDRGVHHPAEEQGRVVATGTPFRRFYTVHFLHVFNALAIPLVVERREMMHRAFPLLVNISVAALAGLRLHEVVSGNVLPILGLNRTGEELALRAVAFVVHHGGSDRRILYAKATGPRDGAHPPGTRRNPDRGRKE